MANRGNLKKRGSAAAARAAKPSTVEATPRSRDVYQVFRGESLSAASDERLIHQRTRLAIVSMLAVNDALTFNELKELLNTTDGNLSVHARKLEEADYVDCRKSFDGRVPKTEYSITAKGRRALERYLGHMESLIEAVRQR